MSLGHDLTLHILYAQHFCSRQAIGVGTLPSASLSLRQGLESWDWKSKLLAWLTLDFPEQDIEDKRMLWDHLWSKVTLGSVLGVCSHQRPLKSWDREENSHLLSQIPLSSLKNKCLGQPFRIYSVSDKNYHSYIYCEPHIFLGQVGRVAGHLTISMVFSSWKHSPCGACT